MADRKAERRDAGRIAFGKSDMPLPNTRVLNAGDAICLHLRLQCTVRRQDAHLADGGVAHDGEVATRLGLPPISVCAEM